MRKNHNSSHIPWKKEKGGISGKEKPTSDRGNK